MISNINQIIKNYSNFQHSRTRQEVINSCNISLPQITRPLSNDVFANKSSVLNSRQYVAFSGTRNYNGFEIFKDIKDLPCPCCGKIMITPAEKDEFVNNIKDAKGTVLAENLNKYFKNLPESRKKLFEILIETAKNNPELGLKELLEHQMNTSLKELEDKQKDIISEISTLAKRLNNKKILNDIVNYTDRISTRVTTKTKDKNEAFSRKKFIGKINCYINSEPTNNSDKKILDNISEEAKKLPTSSTDNNAFIAKYSKLDRDNETIANNLIMPACSTIEHIIPASQKDTDDYSNYIVECMNCNSMRGNIPFATWVREHNDMVQKIKVYINKIIDVITDKQIEGFDDYPEKVKQVLFDESDKKINLYIPRMKQYFRNKNHQTSNKTK